MEDVLHDGDIDGSLDLENHQEINSKKRKKRKSGSPLYITAILIVVALCICYMGKMILERGDEEERRSQIILQKKLRE